MRAQRFQVCALLAGIEEAAGNEDRALALFEDAREQIEGLRSRVWGENSRIAFLRDKLAVYESLVLAYSRRGDYDRAFSALEQAKSRSMGELLASPGTTAHDTELDELLKSLNGDYRQIELATLASRPARKEHLSALTDRVRARERQVAQRFTAIQSGSANGIGSSASVSLDQVRDALPESGSLIEYFEIRGVYHACIIQKSGIRIVPVVDASRIRGSLRFVHLQTARMRAIASDPAQAARITASSARAARHHLAELYQALIRPVENSIRQSSHLIVVPHGLLHEIPFHALFDGKGYLIDRFTISYAPSASVFVRCVARRPVTRGISVVLGVPDEHAPWIEQEVRAVASSLPGSVLFLRQQATEEVLRTYGPDSLFLHVATHCVFRPDNPLFSAIRLGGSRLSLLDLYRIPLRAELVALSGCSTGLNAITAGDELLGLIRGLLGAGARSVLASLWDVNDSSTAEFMTCFYNALRHSGNKAAAMRTAMLEIRREHPHPYYWAAFVLVGAPGLWRYQ